MWILKNSTNLLSSLAHLGVHKATSIQTFDFSTLYTSIPHDLLKSRNKNIINNAFKHKNGATLLVLIFAGTYFCGDRNERVSGGIYFRGFAIEIQQNPQNCLKMTESSKMTFVAGTNFRELCQQPRNPGKLTPLRCTKHPHHSWQK